MALFEWNTNTYLMCKHYIDPTIKWVAKRVGKPTIGSGAGGGGAPDARPHPRPAADLYFVSA